MQSHRMVTKPFRKQNPKDIVKYICTPTINEVRRIFRNVYDTEIKTYKVVQEEPTVSIEDSQLKPCGIVYLKDRRYYAIGYTNTNGDIDIDSQYQLTTPVILNYTLWGPRQRVPWTYMEILQSVNWRIEFMNCPKYLTKSDVALFENSRWIMFAFWIEDIDKLIKLELELMDKLVKIDRRKGGKMGKTIPTLYGLKNMKEMRKYLENQYKRTKFSFNAVEKNFIERTNIGWHIKYVLLEVLKI